MRDRLLRRGAMVVAAKLEASERALRETRQELADANMLRESWKATAEVLSIKVDLYRDALADIASRAIEERNPDGVDQAAATMRMIAREALGLPL